MKKTTIFEISLLSALILICLRGPATAAQKELPRRPANSLPAVLVADEISFDESSHTVLAEGHAVVTYQEITLHADKITMDSQENIICAFASEGKMIRVDHKSVDLLNPNRPPETLSGTFLEYHLNDSTGLLQQAEGTTPVENGMLYISGGKLEVAPPAIAHDKKWVHGKYLCKSQPNDTIIRWNDAFYTTCKQDEPHYRFKSKRAELIPGKVLILHKPRVYIGKRYLFTTPFNINVNQGPRRKTSFSVLPNYDDDKRYGLEAKFKTAWKTGELRLGGAIWTKGISEYQWRVEQKVASWASVYLGNNHLFDNDLHEIKDRPFWGAKMEHSGWALDVGWAEREKRSIVKSAGDKDYETTIWRKPEVQITAPWIGLHIGDFSQYMRFKGNWGRFQETGTRRWLYNGDFVERYGWGIDYYTEYPFKVGAFWLTPFFKADYWNYGYKNDRSDRQEITRGTLGIRAVCGIFELGSAWQQRRVSGQSAFGNGWDRVSDEDLFYQRVGVKIGKYLRFSAQAIFDMTQDKHELKTMAYILTYNNSCCTWWEFVYHDDKRSINNNNWMTLSFGINAFPDSRFRWGNHSLENPFGRPGKLTLKAKPGYVPTMMERDGTLQAESAEIRVPTFDI